MEEIKQIIVQTPEEAAEIISSLSQVAPDKDVLVELVVDYEPQAEQGKKKETEKS